VLDGVFTQVIDGSDRFRRGSRRYGHGDGVLADEPPGEGGRVADAGRVDAEENGRGLVAQAEMVAEAQDEDVAGDVGAEVAVGAGPADGVDAPASAPEVVLLLAVGVERDFQRGGQRFEVTGLEAGEDGMVQGILPGLVRGLRVRRRFRGGGMREQGVVPLCLGWHYGPRDGGPRQRGRV
jgi:hypothetical protein